MINRPLFNNYIYPVIIILCIIAIVLFKLPHLSLPFFWDEAFVYAPAIKLMGAGLPSLMPDAIPADYTRGHPLLFHFLATCWLKIFGNSNTSLHTFALIISVSLLLSVYYFGKTVFNKDIAVIATLLLAVQAVFLAQSSFLLPEMLLALFVVLTLLCYLKDIRYGYILFGTALLLTKESGLILIATLVLWFIIEKLIKRDEKFNPGVFLKNLLFLSLPVLIASVYFIIQWRIYGWFFFPEHIGMINLSYESFLMNFRKVYDFIFEEQGRRAVTIAMVILFILFYKPLSFGSRILLAFFMLASVKIFFGAWKMPPFFTLTVCGILLLLLFYFICAKKYSENPSQQNKALSIFFLYALFFMLFASINFLSKRYLLNLMPVYTLLIAYIIYEAFYATRWLLIIVSVSAVFFSAYKNTSVMISGDDNLSYVKVIQVQREVIGYMEANDLYNANVHATFLINFELANPYSGFLSGDKRFTNASDALTDSTQYAILTNYYQDNLTDTIQHSSNFKEIKQFENGEFWAKIYQRK